MNVNQTKAKSHMPSQRVFFENERSIKLAGIVDSPTDTPVAYAVFAHCFTCTKDLKAIVKISRRLASKGITVLRFDFTGLGASQGVFADSNFETNLEDVRAAVKFMESEYQLPSLLIGHSLGGAAMMAVVNEFDSVTALATLASPSCTAHLADTLLGLNPRIEQDGEGEVVIGGRSHLVRTQMLEVLRSTDLESKVKAITAAHLILHSPVDRTLKYEHAEKLLRMVTEGSGPKSLVTLDGSDHLLVNQADDVNYVSDIVFTWASRYFDAAK